MQPHATLWDYYVAVWKKGRELEGLSWIKRVGGEIVPLAIGAGILAYIFGVSEVVGDARLGWAAIGMSLISVGVWRMLTSLVRAPYEIHRAEHREFKQTTDKMQATADAIREDVRTIAAQRDEYHAKLTHQPATVYEVRETLKRFAREADALRQKSWAEAEEWKMSVDSYIRDAFGDEIADDFSRRMVPRCGVGDRKKEINALNETSGWLNAQADKVRADTIRPTCTVNRWNV